MKGRMSTVTLHEIRRLRKVRPRMLYLMGDSAHQIVLNSETPHGMRMVLHESVSPTLKESVDSLGYHAEPERSNTASTMATVCAASDHRGRWYGQNEDACPPRYSGPNFPSGARFFLGDLPLDKRCRPRCGNFRRMDGHFWELPGFSVTNACGPRLL
jgi:hypothetical protein